MRLPLADRLRDVVGAVATTGRAPAFPQPQGGSDRVADVLGGEWQGSRGQRYLVVDRSYAPGHRHGRVAIMDGMPPPEGIWPGFRVLCGGDDGKGPQRALPEARSLEPEADYFTSSSDPRSPQSQRLLFVDLETTGVAGGAGTYAFLVGCGWFDGATFRIRQFFLSSYGAEPALLEGVTRLAEGATGIVTFNGKSFDLPLIETRYLFYRMEMPFLELPHVDMLHPARRLWRAGNDRAGGSSGSCRLSVLERSLCGVVRDGDVDGFEIPSRYFTYVRTGDPRPLEAVFEHNRLDLVSLALVSARAAQLLEAGAEAARTGPEALGLGRIYERAGLVNDACACYTRVTRLPGDVVTRAEALRSYAVMCRRARRYADAALAWQEILDLRRSPPRLVCEATEALAIHHEHRVRDLKTARRFAMESLGFYESASREHLVRHRLARLDRKLARTGATSLAPFLPGV
jgi:hypothetical protein